MKKEEKIFIYTILSLSLLIIGLTLYAYWRNNFLNFNYFLGTDKLGHFGDFIGGFLGTILTGLATYLVYKTYISQKEELELQRKLIAQQQFETTFFNMLNVHRELKKGFSFNINVRITNYTPIDEVIKSEYGYILNKDDSYKPISYFNELEVLNFIRQEFIILYKSFIDLKSTRGSQNFGLNIIKNEILVLLIDKRELLNSNEKEIIEQIFWIIFYNYRNILSHYFRNVYHILKFIRENELKNKENYRKYADIFQSQLNEDEQFLLFYNFIAFEDKVKKKLSTINICNHYKFLENLGYENLLDNEKHNNKNFYNFEIK